LSGVVFVRSPSLRIHLLQQKVKHHFKYHVSYVGNFFYKRDVTCSWPLPLSQTVTPCRTPPPRAWRTLWTAPKQSFALWMGS